MFEPGVLPDVFPQPRERKTRKLVAETPTPIAGTEKEAQEENKPVKAISESTGATIPLKRYRK
jgi:hypothetical protein